MSCSCLKLLRRIRRRKRNKKNKTKQALKWPRYGSYQYHKWAAKTASSNDLVQDRQFNRLLIALYGNASRLPGFSLSTSTELYTNRTNTSVQCLTWKEIVWHSFGSFFLKSKDTLESSLLLWNKAVELPAFWTIAILSWAALRQTAKQLRNTKKHYGFKWA